MKKRIPYLVALAWMMIVALLSFADGLSWSNSRKVSSYHDGCAAGNSVYLTEYLEDDSVLYKMDYVGNVERAVLSSSVEKGGMFHKLLYRDGLYAAFEMEVPESEEQTDVMVKEYRILQFDENGYVLKSTSGLRMEHGERLTGFTADKKGFYLTALLEDQEAAGAYFVGNELLVEVPSADEEKETEKPPAVNLEMMDFCESDKGRKLVEARYESGQFLTWTDDGVGAEQFAKPVKLEDLFRSRNVTTGQLLTMRSQGFIFYIEVLLAGYLVILGIMLFLRNQNHMVYTIVIVEVVMFLVIFAGAAQMPRVQEAAKRDEAERFGYYYIHALSNEIKDTTGGYSNAEGYYDSDAYFNLQERLERFVEQDDIVQLFTDICLVRANDHQIMVSASGRNGLGFETVYTQETGQLMEVLADGNRRGSVVIRLDGQPCQVFGVPMTSGLKPEYLLVGIAEREEIGSIFSAGQRMYLVYALMLFLAGSAVSVVLLIWQNRELQQLAVGMKKMAGGDVDVRKGSVHGRDVDQMWNSLLETGKVIRRINYTKYLVLESCYRFAPKHIEKIFRKDSITEVQGGDSVQIRGTMAVISAKQPDRVKQNLASVMNRYVTLVEKHQEDSNGMFVSGQSDLHELKVLFLDDARGSVSFGTGLMHELCGTDLMDTMKTSIFLHYTDYLYGIAGTDRQSFPYLLSDNADEIEQYAQWFQKMNVRMVVTEPVKEREQLSEAIRYIGYIYVNGETTEPLKLYEVLDACPAYERMLKQNTDGKFQKALKLFYQHDFYFARNLFTDILKENPADRIAKWYLFTCEKYLNTTGFKGDEFALQCDERFAEHSDKNE